MVFLSFTGGTFGLYCVAMSDQAVHTEIERNAELGHKLNWLRAAVLGANDGIISVAGLVIGVLAAGVGGKELLTVAAAALIAGAVSMALGEYVSVSTQRDTEDALVKKEQYELEHLSEEEHDELVNILAGYGISRETAERAASELSEDDKLKTHLALELGIDPNELVRPAQAAYSSALAFTAGAIIPVLAGLAAPKGMEIGVVFLSTMAALMVTGWISAHLGEASRSRAMLRLVVGGAIAMGFTWMVGQLFGVAVS